MGDGLIERLNKKEVAAISETGVVKGMRLRNPDGPEAASRIAQLEAKLATAVGALEQFRARCESGRTYGTGADLHSIADQALASIQERTS